MMSNSNFRGTAKETIQQLSNECDRLIYIVSEALERLDGIKDRNQFFFTIGAKIYESCVNFYFLKYECFKLSSIGENIFHNYMSVSQAREELSTLLINLRSARELINI